MITSQTTLLNYEKHHGFGFKYTYFTMEYYFVKNGGREDARSHMQTVHVQLCAGLGLTLVAYMHL